MTTRSGQRHGNVAQHTARTGHRQPPHRREYPVAPVAPWGLALWLWLPLLAVACVIVVIHADNVRHGHPAALYAHLTLLLAIAVSCTAAHARRGIRLQDDRLIVRSTLFTKQVPVDQMRLDTARVVDLAEHPAFKPGRKSLGFGYPGFHSGYYRSRQAGQGFYLITQSARVLTLPLKDGSVVVLSPEQPRQLLQDLQQLAAQRA
ncbi:MULTISPECIES: PH domain-containing protein [Xanthomonas]|uniref:PH domain-containing protein n=1 Tax=Xanthomonas TaxID=338 RepID=UPI000E1E374D|nr:MULTISPECIES: PH domain-containing protein [Xanthomonas]